MDAPENAGFGSPLPIDPHLPRLLEQLTESRVLVLTAPPAAGKTTRLPPAMLDAGLLGEKRLLLLEPRRIAARAAARRMAAERGEEVGETVGFQVRFDKRQSSKTRILVVTEGILTRKMQSDPFLEGVGAVLLDEFHERSIHTDLALALLREIRRSARPDLLLVVMSATLATEPLAKYLDCPVIKIPVAAHPLETRYLSRRDGRPVPVQAAEAVRKSLLQYPDFGDVLVFLPGMGEIRRTADSLVEYPEAANLDILPLHGALPIETQDRALAPSSRRKVVLATNVAETSLTIEGVRIVIDSGFARILKHDPRRGIDRLERTRISKASATQRAGRAGRTGPGTVYRLWTRSEESVMPEVELPEIRRIDLSAVILEVLAWGGEDPREFAWFEPPSSGMVDSALDLLAMLGAVDQGNGSRLTPLGREMRRLPIHPRLALMMLNAAGIGAVQAGALLAALLSERDILRSGRGGSAIHGSLGANTASDVLYRAELLERTDRSRSDGSSLPRALDLNPGAARTVRRTADQLARIAGGGRSSPAREKPSEEDLLRLLLTAFPDRVARRRDHSADEYLMVGGRGAVLSQDSVVRGEAYILGLVVEGSDRKTSLIRKASRIERAWLEDLFPATIRTQEDLVFDEERKKVVATRIIRYHDLPLEGKEVKILDEALASTVLLQAVKERIKEALNWDSTACDFIDRVRALRSWMPELSLPELDSEALKPALPALCAGKRSFEETRKEPLLKHLKRLLNRDQLSALERHAPQKIVVPSGREIMLDYRSPERPRLAVRVQELFGLTRTPTVAAGRIPVLLDLLGPNMRTVQRTDDLAGFWKNTYSQVRKDLRGRYPKHHWPEDPLTADPRLKPGKKPKK